MSIYLTAVLIGDFFQWIQDYSHFCRDSSDSLLQTFKCEIVVPFVKSFPVCPLYHLLPTEKKPTHCFLSVLVPILFTCKISNKHLSFSCHSVLLSGRSFPRNPQSHFVVICEFLCQNVFQTPRKNIGNG